MRRPYLPKSKFSVLEDKILGTTVDDLGTSNWPAIAANLPGRRASQCRGHWHDELELKLGKRPWLSTDDERLLEIYAKYGPQFDKIASFFPARLKDFIRKRILTLLGNDALDQAGEAPRPAGEQRTDNASESGKDLFPSGTTMNDNSMA
jgi:hypothetical protein